MRRLRNCIIALLIGMCTPLLIWVAAGAALYQHNKARRLQIIGGMVCSTDTECPPGFMCTAGRCVPRQSG